MLSRKKIGLALLTMVSILLLAACNRPDDTEPTPDTNMVYTQAAQTVAAQLAAQATVAPTLDPNLIRTEAAQTVEAEMAKKATATPPLATVAPLNTVAPIPVLSSPTVGVPVTSTGNTAEWLGQWPVDGSNITVGTDVDVQWTLKNTGTKTWTKEYQYRFYLGEGQFHKYTAYYMPKEVLPGEEVTLTVDMKSNLPNGNYYELWVLTDNFGANFSQFDVRFTVGGAVPTSDNINYTDKQFCCEQRRADQAITITRCTDWAQNIKLVDPVTNGPTTGWDTEDIDKACGR